MLAWCFVIQNTIDDGHTQPSDLKHGAMRASQLEQLGLGNISYNWDNEGVTQWEAEH